jgi:hypothetical protein
MNQDKDDDKFWSEVGGATSARRSPTAWAAQRARLISILRASDRRAVRPWFALAAAGALACGVFLVNGGIVEKILQPAPAIVAAVWDARLTTVDGLVTVTPKGATDPVTAYAGMPIAAGDRIVVGQDGRAELGLAAESLIELGPGASMTVSSLEERYTFLDLDLGSFVAKFHWDKALGRRLDVRTPTAVASVRGTEFGLTVAPDGETAVAVFDEGRVAVRAKDAPALGETMLEPHQETDVTHGQPATEPRDGRDQLRVGPLSRMEPYHDHVERIRDREQELRSTWTRIPPTQRAATRSSWNSPAPASRTVSAPAPTTSNPSVLRTWTPRAHNPNPVRPQLPSQPQTPTQNPTETRAPSPSQPHAPSTPQPGGHEATAPDRNKPDHKAPHREQHHDAKHEERREEHRR